MQLKGKKVHIIGICGIGMSTIAMHLNNLGAIVQGSDIATDGEMGENLRSIGINVSDHSAENITENLDFIVRSTAIQDNNIEIVKARELGIPILSRSDILSEITRQHSCVVSITGAHGKTTTTTMTGELLYKLARNPTVFSGGVMGFCDSNFRSGSEELMVVEADESDGTFMRLKTDIAVVTNIEFEHAEFYKDFNEMIEAYEIFVNNINVQKVIICGDDPGIKSLRINPSKEIISYGFDQNNDIYAKDIEFSGDKIDFTIVKNTKEFGRFSLNAIGIHNVLNVLSAFAVSSLFCSSDDEFIKISKEMMQNFRGVARRFNLLPNNKNLTIIDDYAHHPTEIRATIAAAKQMGKRVIAVIQPHRYTRLHALMDDFVSCLDEADIGIITEVYSAGEIPIEGVSGERLYNGILGKGKAKEYHFISTPDELYELLDTIVMDDVVVFMGAGNITTWAKSYAAL
jgi:UDP-N-acetylmuramate--alanine ligase